MARLSYGERKKLPTKDFAVPSKRGKAGEAKAGKGAYPIPDASHARNALARVAQHGSAGEKAEVRQKVHAKFPAINGERKRGVADGKHTEVKTDRGDFRFKENRSNRRPEK